MGKTKRILCFLVALIMILSIVPINSIVFAIGVETAEGTENTQTETPSVVPSGTSSSGLPSATVKKLASETVTDYRVYDLIGKGSLTEGNGVLDPQVLMQFIAKDTAEEAKKNQYANYTTDFFIKVEGLEQPTAGTGCYLIGNYGSFGWIAIPLDGINVENTVYPVITPVGFNFTYVDICESVKDFKCGIYFTTEFLNANPDFKITLELGLSANADKAIAGEYIKVGDSYTYSATGLQTPTDFVVDGKLNAEDEAVKEVMSNTSLDKFIPVNVPDGAQLVVTLKSVGDTIVYDIAPMKDGKEVENLTEAIIFRIPVPASITESYVKLTHDGKYAGIYEVKGTGNAKYIQVSSADFSEFALEPVSTAPVASVNGITYATFAEALTAANALAGDVTVEIYGKVEYADATASLTGAYDSITFIGMTDDAEISITRNGSNGYISGDGNDCVVNFKDLILSKPAGFYANDAGDMNVAFTVYRVGAVNYTSCKFPNGACAAGCPTTYTECTFQKSHDKYAVWAYGADVTINECVFDDDRGIKMYAEGAAKTTEVTVTNSDFSKLTSKPAIVATLGESITLSGNTYSDTGVLELEDNGSSNGITIDSEDEVTCVSDAYPNGCGVLVDGVIYRTVAEAAAVATEGDTVTLLHNSAETVELPEGVTLDTNGYTAENVTVKAPAYVAMIGEVGYETLAEAFEAAQSGDTITLLDNITIESDLNNSGKGIFNIADGVSITLDLNGKTIDVTDNSAGNFIVFYNYGEFTIKNGTVNLTATIDRDWNAQSTIILNRGGILNVEGGTYTHNGGTDMAFVLDNSGNWYGDATTNVYEGTTLTSSYIAIRNRMEQNSHGSSGKATLNVYGGKIEGTSRAIWAQAASTSTTAPATGAINVSGGEIGLIDTARSEGAVSMTTITGGTVSGFKGEVGELTVTGGTLENVTILSASGEEVDFVINGDGVYEEITGVAQIGDTVYATLEEAFKAATEGCVIEILADVVIDYKWDCRDYATNGSHSQFKESVTINGNDKTIKFTNAISDGNWNTVFRFEENAVVNNLTIDISEATGALRVITAKKSLTVDGLTIVGSAKYGIIFGEGATADDLAATEIVIKNSNLNGTRRAISDNEGGKDIKSAIITDNTLNANVYVSASESITFNNNTTKGEVDLRSYTANNALNVTAQGNTLTSGVKNYIEAGGTVDAQEGFDVPKVYVAMIGEVGYETLAEAIAALKDGDTLTILAGEHSEGTIKFSASLNNVTIKGENGAILKDMTLMASDGSNISYTGITFDGITFENSNILFPGQRASAVFKDWTIKNCTFNNVAKGNAAINFNLNTSEAMENFTFTGNTINGVTGGNYSGLVLRASKGTVVVTDNNIQGAVWNAIQLINSTADTLTITGNTFASGADEGVLNLYGVTATALTIKNNKFLVTEGQPGICYLPAGDVSENYWNGNAPANLPAGVTCETYYADADLTELITIKKPVAQIGDVQFETVADALAYAKEQGIVDLVITIIGENTRETADTFSLASTTIFDSVTIKQDNGGKVYYFDGLYTGSRTNSGTFVFDGVNIIVTEQYMFQGNVKLTNNSVVKSVAEANCFHYYSTTTVEAGSQLLGVIDELRGGDIIIDGGLTNGTFNDIPGLQDAILGISWNGDSLTLQNGAYVKINSANEIGRVTISSGTSLNVYDSKLEGVEYITNEGTINIDIGSIITTGKITGAGTINVDATGLIGSYLVIDADMSGFTGSINILGNGAFSYEITSEGLVVTAAEYVAEVNGVKYAKLDDAVAYLKANGGTMKLLGNVAGSMTFNDKYGEFATKNPITIDLNGFTITSNESTLWVSDGYVVTVKDSVGTGRITTTTNDAAVGIARNGKVILESGTVEGIAFGVYIYDTNDTDKEVFVMNGGTITVPNGGIAFGISSGMAVINNGNVICNKTPISGGGWNSVVYDVTATLAITGGNFYGTIGNWGVIAISGGTFSYPDDPNDGFNSAHLAAGYGTQTNDDGSITVVKLPVAAKIGDTEYETIEAALKAAKNGDTIVLLADCAMAEVVGLKDIALTIEGNYTITLNDKLKVLGETTLNITSALVGEVLLEDGAIIANSTINGSVYIQGNVTFRGKNTFVMMYDYGTAYTPNHQWTLEKGASLTLTSTDRYGFGYGDKITIVGSIADALTARETITDSAIVVNMYGGLVGMTNSSYADTNSKFEAKDAYIIFGVNGDKSFGNKPNNSNKNVYYYGNYEYIFTNSVVTANGFKFYEDNGNSVVVFTDSDLLVNGVFMTNDASSKFTFTNCIILSKATLNGNDDKNQNAGEMILIGTSLTYNAMFTNNGTIKLDANSCLTAPSIVGNGKIIIDLAGFTGTKTIINANMTGFTGTIEIINNDRATFKSLETGVVVTVSVPEVPSATTNPVVLRPELVYGLNFSADSITPEQLEYFGDYFADFVITFNQDVTLDADGDVYLTGEYGDYGWISVPFEPITIKAGESIRIMEYAAELFDKEELQITYKDVVELVKNFNCGVYVSPEFAAANPGFEVSINLNMYDPADETKTPIAVECVDKVTQQPTQTTFGNKDIKRVVASVIDAEGNETFYLTLAEAIAAAQDGETVKLYEDVDSVGTIDKAITINGNKFTLNGNILILADVTFDGVLSLTGKVKVTNGATLTIAKTANVTGATSFFGAGNDASYYGMANGDAANGTIVINGTLRAQQINANNGGNIVINSGATATFEIVCVEDGNMGEAVGTMTVNGTLNTQLFNIFAGGIATVNAGGLVNSEQAFTSSDLANVISIWGGGELNINGGKVVCAIVEHTEGRHSGVNVADGAINMTAGEFICGGNLVLSGKLSVTGGSADIASIESTGDIYLEGDATITTPTEGLSITAPAGYNVVYAAGVYSVEEKPQINIEISGRSISLDTYLQLNLYFEKADFAGVEEIYVVIQIGDHDAYTVKYGETGWNVGTGIEDALNITGIAAKEIGDEIKIQFYLGNPDDEIEDETASDLITYSIKQYAYTVLGSKLSTEAKRAMYDLLKYGAAAQIYFNYKTDDLVDAGLGEYSQYSRSENAIVDKYKEILIGEEFDWGNTMSLDDSLVLNYYFKTFHTEQYRGKLTAKATYIGWNNKLHTINIDSSEFLYNDATGETMIALKGLSGGDVASDITLEVYDENGNVIYKSIYSIEAYLTAVIAKRPANAYLYQAIANYGEATAAYLRKINNVQ